MAVGERHLVIEPTLALLSFQVLRSAHEVDELLHPGFRETGASGRLWTRAVMVAALAGAPDKGECAIETAEMSAASWARTSFCRPTCRTGEAGPASAHFVASRLSCCVTTTRPSARLGRNLRHHRGQPWSTTSDGVAPVDHRPKLTEL
jgi:hypothetical protein